MTTYVEFSTVIDDINTDEERWLMSQLEDVSILPNGVEVASSDIADTDIMPAKTGPRFLMHSDMSPIVDFQWQLYSKGNSRFLRLFDKDGNPEQVALLIQLFLFTWRPLKCQAFTWAVCNANIAQGCSGGGVLITGQGCSWLRLEEILNNWIDQWKKENSGVLTQV